MSRPSSSPIHQIPEIENPEDATEDVEITLDIYEDRVIIQGVTPDVDGGSRLEQNRDPMVQQPIRPENLIGLSEDVIDKEMLRDFCEQISDDQSFDSRLMNFFDMMDRVANGRLTEDEVKEIISFSSSADNLSAIQKKADEYAAMTMEELDPDNIGYISVESLKSLVLRVETQPVSMNSKEREKLNHMIIENFKPTLDLIPLRRWYRQAFRSRRVQILKVGISSGNLLTLHLSRPEKFKYMSGQYMFVNCPTVSPFEWHPFSITSAPKDHYLSVHINSTGDWTKALGEVFAEVCKPMYVPLRRRDMLDDANIAHFPKIRIDGPYGAPAQDYKKYKVVLLVGLGTGATSMISIIKDIINNQMEEQSQEEPQGNRKETFKTRRAYFCWVTRDQGSFDWFMNIMNDIAKQDRSKVIELHNYCTSVYQEGDVRYAFIHMLQSLYHAKTGNNIVSGTRVMSHFAKPNWENVYKQVAMDHPGSHVGVFYCGLPVLTKELRHLALEFTQKTNTKFSFHEVNF